MHLRVVDAERTALLPMACVEFASELLDGDAVALKRDQQMVDEVRCLVANMVVIFVLARHNDFGRLLCDLF